MDRRQAARLSRADPATKIGRPICQSLPSAYGAGRRLVGRSQLRHATAFIFATAALGLGGCSGEEGGVEARNASVEEVANQVREAGTEEGFIRAGRWVSTVKFEEVTAPGMPPEAAEQMRRMMGEGRKYESCLTEEEAQQPSEQFFAQNNSQCRYQHFTMRGGEIDAQMRCSQGEATQVIEMEGSYSPNSYDMRMTTRFEGAPEPASGMRLQMRVDAQRVGQCDGTEA